jgi:hypothetical protein
MAMLTGTMLEFQQELCLGHGWAVIRVMICQIIGEEEKHNISSLKSYLSGALHLCPFKTSLRGLVSPAVLIT